MQSSTRLLRHAMRKHLECRARDFPKLDFNEQKQQLGKLLIKLAHSPRKPCGGQCEAAAGTWGGRRLLRPCPLRTPCPPSSPRQRWTRGKKRKKRDDCTRTRVNAQAHLPARDNYCERANWLCILDIQALHHFNNIYLKKVCGKKDTISGWADFSLLIKV